MPQRYTIKIYKKGGIYHLYNRGTDKRLIFQNEKDYLVFLKYLKEALIPPEKAEKKSFTFKGETFKGVPRRPKNFTKEIDLLAFCLMPNHFHLMVKQKKKYSIKHFTRSIMTRYSMYFNNTNQRTGTLFEGPYKAVLVKDETQLLHLSRYIHLNPNKSKTDLAKAYSSYAAYLGLVNPSWVKKEEILAYFNGKTIPEIKKYNTYQKFVENYDKDSGAVLGRLTLE